MFQPNQFNTGLCDCTDDGSSCVECVFCPWCMTSQSYSMIDTNRPAIDVCMCCTTLLLDVALFAGSAFAIAACMTRRKLNSRFQIAQADECGECLKGLFCPACSACQVYRELSIRQLWPGGMCVRGPYAKPGLVALPPQTMGGAYQVSTVTVTAYFMQQPQAYAVAQPAYVQPGQPQAYAVAQPAYVQPGQPQAYPPVQQTGYPLNQPSYAQQGYPIEYPPPQPQGQTYPPKPGWHES
jgi:Cys-rich protein (TIGR01571 family)